MRDLQRRFPEATLEPAGPELDATIAAVVELVEAPAARSFDVGLDLRGTTFQRRVWQALREIPAGSTATYTEVAERIGAPGSARAVAGACAANPIAVAVPCHRVVRNDVRPLTYCGISVASAAIFADAPSGPFSYRDLMFREAAAGRLTGERYDGMWTDIGTPEQLRRLRRLTDYS